MKSLFVLHLRLMRSNAGLALVVFGVCLVLFVGLAALGDPGATQFLAVAAFAALLVISLAARVVDRAWTPMLPVSPSRSKAARFLVMGGLWLVLASALGVLLPGGPSMALAVNLFALGLVGLAAVDTVTNGLLLGAVAGGLFLLPGDLAERLAAAGWGPTPWLVAAALVSTAVAFLVQRRSEFEPASGAGRGRPADRVRAPSTSLLSIAFDVPRTIGWAFFYLLVAVVPHLAGVIPGFSPASDLLRVLSTLLLVVSAPLILQSSLKGYRHVFHLPLPGRTRFRVFLLPVWLLVALCLLLRGGTMASVGTAPIEALAETLLLLVIATAVFRLQLAHRSWFDVGFGLLVILGSILLSLPSLLGDSLVERGGYLLVAAAAGVVAVLFHDLRTAFARIQWTDLPAFSWRRSR